MYDPEKHHRRSIRIPGYDYSQSGAYFITICTHNRACLFGDVRDDTIALSDAGRYVLETWNNLPRHYPYVELDAFRIMPNHTHGIVWLLDHMDASVGAGLRPALTQRHGIPEIIRAFKSFSAREINRLRQVSGAAVWQRDYFEHVIRDDEGLYAIRDYIITNPQRWEEDKENPLGCGKDDVEQWVEQFENRKRAALTRAGLRPAPTEINGSRSS
jgi:REP element-mobilizing transposase RayT